MNTRNHVQIIKLVCTALGAFTSVHLAYLCYSEDWIISFTVEPQLYTAKRSKSFKGKLHDAHSRN